MGHASSKSNGNFTSLDNEVLDAKVGRAGRKLQAITGLTAKKYDRGHSNLVDEQTRRKRLRDFLRSQKADTRNNYDIINRSTLNEEVFRRRLSKDSTEFISMLPAQLEDDTWCTLCENVTYSFDFQPCRVCFKVFHMKCLQKSPNYGPSETTLIRNSGCLGWTCHDCANLCGTLNPQEVDRIFDLFDRLDIDKDAQINLDEYITYSDRISIESEGRPLTDEEKAKRRAIFHRLDIDGNGNVDWQEFLNHEACQMLANRPDTLVSLLSAKEVRRAKDLFSHYDADQDGLVLQSDIRNAYRNWYRQLKSILHEDQAQEAPRPRRRSRFGSFSRPRWWSRMSRDETAGSQDNPVFTDNLVGFSDACDECAAPNRYEVRLPI